VSTEALVRRYLDHLRVERGLAGNTLDAYRRDLSHYATYLEERGIVDPLAVTPQDVTAFVAWMRSRPSPRGGTYAPATVARATVAVRGLHRFLVDEGLRTDDPAADIDTPSTGRALPKALTLEAVERLLAAPTGDHASALRDRAMLELLYS
jgi:integrase/recombinase XerD